MLKITVMKMIAVCFLAAGLAGIFSERASAEMEVTMSTAASLSVGVKLPGNTKFDIDEGEVVRVVKAGKTYELTGPYTGTLDHYRSTCPWWQDVLGKCSKHRPDTGAVPGVTRGLAR